MTSNKPHTKGKRSNTRPIGKHYPNPKSRRVGVYLVCIAGFGVLMLILQVAILARPSVCSGVLGSDPKPTVVAKNDLKPLDPWK
ncbi:hypothetical protein BCF53_1177 [Reinekea marinisedimentorum]|uniref:Uncharacterized protein n=1 Tax=Reinekea marinisedimentorum TaxID=230495 RepID=A0A4R3HY13_9GAMM|nr:hypothetical protein BCF53_1177 [Reinekea marinisedimentorum]